MSSNDSGTLFRPKAWVAFLIIAAMIGAMVCAIFVTGQQLHITMLTVMGFAIALLVATGCPYSNIEKSIVYGGKLLVVTLITLYTIGSLMGSWIASGTVPMIIYWGLRLINPSLFLVTACVACMITAMATGSSWSTIGTVGVALMGVGLGLNMPPAMTAGAIISGAAFGDKMSPMSDTTNVAPAVAEADLFDHIKAMLTTGGPAIVLALIGFGILGMRASGSADSETIAKIMETLDSTFKLNIFAILPLILVLVLAAIKFPAFPTLLISALFAAFIAVTVQGTGLYEIMSIMEGGFSSNTGFYEIDRLLTRGGMFSMHYNCALTCIVMVFGGILEKCGVLDVILEHLKILTRTVGTMVATTVVVEILLNIVTASQYLTLILGGKMMVPAYKEKKMLPQTLSRTLEDSGTVTSLLFPWNLCGAFATGALGVNALVFAPYSLFNWLCPLIAVIWGFTGLFQWKTGDIPSKKTYADAAGSN